MKKVTVVGVGALGSQFIQMARNFDVLWKVIDFDRVEQKNIMSQFHSKMVSGRNKAQAISTSMQGLFGVRVEPCSHRLEESNADVLLSGSSLIVDCVDNGATRVLIKQWAEANDVPCLHGALSADGQLGRVVWSEDFNVDYEDVEGQPTCDGGEFLPFIGLTACALAMRAQSFLETGSRAGFQCFANGVRSL